MSRRVAAAIIVTTTVIVRAQAPAMPDHGATRAYNVALGVTCWSCHRGHTAPPRLPRADWESIAAAHAPRTQCCMCHQGHTRVER